MPDDIETLQRWMVHPDTNHAVMRHLIADFSQPPEFTATMKVLHSIWSDDDAS